jgi:hypothetical protein
MIGLGNGQLAKPLSCISNRSECFPSGTASCRRWDPETITPFSKREKTIGRAVGFYWAEYASGRCEHLELNLWNSLPPAASAEPLRERGLVRAGRDEGATGG